MVNIDDLYEKIVTRIRSHFTETVRSLEPLAKYSISIRFGGERKEPLAYGEERKMAGLFTVRCFYKLHREYLANYIQEKDEILFNEDGKQYAVLPGEAETIKLIVTAFDFEKEHLIADIMIAAACNEIARGDRWRLPVPLAKELSMKAKEVLKKNGLGWWRPSTKNYIYRNDSKLKDELRGCLNDEKPDAYETAEVIIREFKAVTDDSDGAFEVVWAYSENKECFLYEQKASLILKELIQKHAYGRISDGELAGSILRFENVDRENIAYSYGMGAWDKEFVQMVDARIDNVVHAARARIPNMSLALEEYKEQKQEEERLEKEKQREYEKQLNALIKQGYDPSDAIYFAGIDFEGEINKKEGRSTG